MTQKYRPSNGSEGEGFQAVFCDNCEKDREYRETENNPCLILTYVGAFNIDDEKYPSEWQIGADGKPCCTAFEPERAPLERAAAPEPRCEKTIDLFTGGSHG